MRIPDEKDAMIHSEALHERSYPGDSPVILAAAWVVSALILMGFEITLHGHSGTLLAGMR